MDGSQPRTVSAVLISKYACSRIPCCSAILLLLFGCLWHVHVAYCMRTAKLSDCGLERYGTRFERKGWILLHVVAISQHCLRWVSSPLCLYVLLRLHCSLADFSFSMVCALRCSVRSRAGFASKHVCDISMLIRVCFRVRISEDYVRLSFSEHLRAVCVFS